VKDTASLNNVDNNIGIIYNDLQKPDLAVTYFDEALAGYKQRDNIRGIIVVYGNKSVSLSKMGRYKEAIALNEKVIELSGKYNLSKLELDALKNISGYWMQLGDYKKAYDYLASAYALNDSINGIEKTRIINDLTMKYEKKKDQALILELEKNNLEKDLNLKRRTIQRNAYLFTGLGILLSAMFLILLSMQRARKDKIIAAQKIRQLEEEKKFMAARLIVEGQEEERKRIAQELHDGLGVLLSTTKIQFTAIKDLSPENRPHIEKAIQLLERASGDVRKISHNMMPGLLTKLGLYEAIEDLVDNLNESGNIDVICDIPENPERLSENKEIMLYRVVQEMVNNTLKHAAAKNISIRITQQAGIMQIFYSDDGKGFDYNEKLESGSIGLKSIQSRVSFINGKLEIDTHPGKGVNYIVSVPL
jgi:signal transduction histidine kinase